MGLAELRRLWGELVGKKAPPTLKRLLVRELAWHLQRRVHGDLDADTRRLLRAAVRLAANDSGVPERKSTRRAKPRPRLEAGTKLVRTWHGRTHEVVVLEHGKRFRYRGRAYRSLTEIAEKITGAHWSGPRFFGLHRVRSVG